MAFPSLRRAALVAAVIGLAGLVIAPPAAAAAPRPPHIKGTETAPVYDYASAVRESVWVTTKLDNDGDGAPDKVVVDLVRPREAAAGKVPVIMDASPYYQCCGRGNESELKEYAADGSVTKFPLFYDNYFVPRGYAFAAVDFNGTSRSTGCGDVGGREEIEGVKAVIDWLNGRAKGAYADGTPARASWTTGKVGMIGKSWDGSVANGVAATGVEGLETIVPIAAISSWYDYYRDNGALYTIDGGPAWLSGYVNGRPDEVCQPVRDALYEGSANATGDYNSFWAERNFVPDARKVRASVFIAHGINDNNVETKHFAQWWDALARAGVPRKIWLGQEGHVDPFDFRRAEWVDTLHRWFDYWLQDLDNGIMREPMATIERAPDVWVDEPAWPARGAFTLPVSLGAGDGTTGTLGLRPSRGEMSIVDNPALRERAAVANPNTVVAGRSVFLSAPLERNLRISGTATVSLRVKVDKPNTEISARLVDYGTATRINYQGAKEGIRNLTTESCHGASIPADDACYLETAKDVVTADAAIMTRGWVDAAHRDSLTRPTQLRPGRWYTVTFDLNAHDAVLPAGRVLGLVLTLSDTQYTVPTSTGATVQVDLSRSRLGLPVSLAPGATALPDATVAPKVSAPAPRVYAEEPDRESGLIPQG
ncbi:Xaa-Pro dipeptidyl-peptidase [Actinophytocola algeriensis]|uniref:Xaa-Pro dipeptidyl-peptidase n=1 Tax=Actinophytocola algeriensis TaxID=1768010 RepID=A0A7W7Q9S5_9PSEU|nr:Xaa-Pro dipeptidyl-peptidase [Actinophytocola algeriensis]MBB4909666.1 X-Pro dipeptidyl-peptidase [Actinophytocola algeriensis]MBE1475656.1 X-Pro dipeptidyl-peptidase [Actinophytocola algeriensis]